MARLAAVAALRLGRRARTSLSMERVWRTFDEGQTSGTSRLRLFAPYLAALLLTLAGVAARVALHPVLGGGVAFLFFVPALLVGAGVDGLAGGLVATVLGLAAGLTLLHHYGLTLAGRIEALLFVCLGVSIALGGERLKRTQGRALESYRQVLEREAHMRSILDAIPDGMIVIDEAGVVQAFSAAAERLFGWSREEMVGRNVSLLMAPPDRDAHDAHLQRYARTGEAHIIGIGRTVTAQRKDGATFTAQLSVGEMRSGGRTFFTGFINDLSARLETEERLQVLQSELVHISRLSAMGEMASTLAHELNQPLSAISNYLKGGQRLLIDENPHSRAIAPMGKAAEQSLRAGQIIRRLRDFVERGESERRIESLSRLMDEISALGLLGYKELGVTVRIERDPEIDPVMVDKVQVQQVLLNLVRNALEAMEGQPRRDLLITVRPSAGDMVEVAVADTGSGISPQVADRLFQPFVSTKGRQGMGVGLSICRTIVEAHGGRIWAEPRAGGGAVFSFTIPRADVQEGVA